MSKIKYPDKDTIKKQIDQILDKSELFDKTETKSVQTDDKIVELKPVRDNISVKKLIPIVLSIAAIVVFVMAVKNYSVVTNDNNKSKVQIPLATTTDETKDVYLEAQSKAEMSTYYDVTEDDYEMRNSVRGMYDGLSWEKQTCKYYPGEMDESTGYSYDTRIDTVVLKDGTILNVSVPVNFKYDGESVIRVQERIWNSINDIIKESLNNNPDQYEILVGAEINGDHVEFRLDGKLNGMRISIDYLIKEVTEQE